jgi:NAD(P)-dependent dehydrogenase (short-subunit alcohol dehydrogenase family)
MKNTIIIYGASGGVGSATAEQLHQRGYDLHLVGRDQEKVKAIALKYGASFTLGDVTDPALFPRVMEGVQDALSGLVYAVGTINLGRLSRLTLEDFEQDFQVNALGAALAVQAAVPQLKKNESGAAIVLFSSVATRQGFPLHTSMGMAKGAIDGLTVSLAAELAPKIRVNAIAPSLTRTPLAARILSNEKMAEGIANLHPMGRLGEAGDMASLCAFLLSPESGWITGQIIGLDGGRSTLRS